MPRKKRTVLLKEPVRQNTSIKVQLDARTVITLGSTKALDFWKKRYPQAKVIA